MALSTITYSGDGTTTSYVINFPLGFLNRSDVTLKVNGVLTSFEWVTDGLVTVSPAPVAGTDNVVFYRTVTSEELKHNYSDGVAIQEENLDQSNLQHLMLINELKDGRHFEATANQIAADAALAADSAADALASEVASAANAADTAADVIAAQAAATTATTQASNASASATAAATSASDAAASAATFSVTGTSTSTVTVGTGSKVFATQTGRSWVPGATRLRIATADATKIMDGEVTAYSGGNVTVDVDYTEGSLSSSSWNIAPIGPRGTAGASGGGSGDMVSTANLSDVANAATAFNNIKQITTTGAAGVIELATTAEAQTGTDTVRAITPATLQAVTSTETRAGVIELATTAEAQTGSDATRAITPASLQTVTATDTRKGVVELSTDAEAQAGSDTTRALTPANLQAVTATDTRKGVVELATDAEAITGTDTTRALTPASGKAAYDAAITAALAAYIPPAAEGGWVTIHEGNFTSSAQIDKTWTAGLYSSVKIELYDISHSGTSAVSPQGLVRMIDRDGAIETASYIYSGVTGQTIQGFYFTDQGGLRASSALGDSAVMYLDGLLGKVLQRGLANNNGVLINNIGSQDPGSTHLATGAPYSGVTFICNPSTRNFSTNVRYKISGILA